MEIYKVSGEIYGWIFAGLSAGFIGSSQVNSFLLRRFTSEKIIPAALIFQLTIAAIFLITTYFGLLDLWKTAGLLFLYLSTLGFIAPNTSALSMAPFSRNAGSASSLMGALQMGIGALASVGVSLSSSRTAIPMTAIMAFASALALIILFLGKRKIKENQELKLEAENLSKIPAFTSKT